MLHWLALFLFGTLPEPPLIEWNDVYPCHPGPSVNGIRACHG